MPSLRAFISVFLACAILCAALTSSEVYAGEKWVIHRVLRGENLTSIAQKYDVSVGEIVQWNDLRDANHIFVGQKLKIERHEAVQTTIEEKDVENHSSETLSGDAKALRLVKPSQLWSVVVGYRTHGDIRHYGLLCRVGGNAPVFPAHTGKVAKVGHMRGYGKYILIDHGSGWHSMYSNLQKIYVKPGQYVSLKDSIGAVEDDKLFFLLAFRGKPVNPTGYFR